MESESGDDNPPTSRRGQNTSFCFHRAHREQKRAVTTAGKGGHTATVQNIYGAPHPPEEHHETIDASTELRSGRTGTSQCSSYQIEIRGNGTVSTYDCDHERHAGATENTCLGKN